MPSFQMNQDQVLRERYLVPDGSQRQELSFHDLERFDLKLDQIKSLLEHRFLDPEEKQNNSPSVQEFIEFAENHPIGFFEVIFESYAVYLPRPDYRVTIEGIRLEGEIPKEVLIDFSNQFLGADEFQIGGESARAWWD